MTARQVLMLVAAIGAGLAGGVFFAFSTFVMSGLARLSDRDGVVAMQAINLQAPTPAFMSLLFGTAALALGLGVDAVVRRAPGWGWVVAGGVAYLLAIVVTAVVNVPRNDRLAALDPASAEAAAPWATYLREWVLANHVRTASCTAAAVSLTLALRAG